MRELYCCLSTLRLFFHFNVTFNIDLNKISLYFYPLEILVIDTGVVDGHRGYLGF